MTWTNRRVLVTGAGGFIGSHLTERLAREGARVRALCRYNSMGSGGWLDRAPSEILSALDIHRGDILDARFVEEACRDVEIVFHLAAIIAIPYSYQAPAAFFETNVRGTMNVLEAVKRGGARMVHCSTSEVYGTPDSLPIRETHALRGQSPYSASKIAADKLCEAYACSYDTPVVMIRPFNTYGPRQSTRAVIPTILSQLLSGVREVHLGNLSPRRDLTYVSDTVEGFLLAAEAEMRPGDVIHLGTGQNVSVLEIFEAACRILGIQARALEDGERVRPQRSEVQTLLSDPSRARERLGWRATISLEAGLRLTADWIKNARPAFRTV